MTPAAIVLLATAATTVVDGPAGEPRPAAGPPASDRSDDDRASRRPDVVVPAVHGLALLTVMRATETVLWPDPFGRPKYFGHHYEEAFTEPPLFDPRAPFMRWDGDPLAVNAVGHGLFGSELYLRARQCRLGWAGSLAFTAATSALWEYGFEGSGVRPSAQDLVYTPLMGLLLGEARYQAYRLAGRMRAKALRAGVRAVVDPFGELERAAGTDC